MDATLFGGRKTGELVPLSVPAADWAFVPDPLPPDWEFPVELWPLLSEARTQLGRLDGIGRTLPNPDLLLQPLQSREAVRSSSLEGTYATPEELFLFELEPRQPKSAVDPVHAHREVANYRASLRRGMDLLEELPFCLRLIRELHRQLLDGVRGSDQTPGQFRRTQNHIGSSRRFVPPPPDALDTCLGALEQEMNAESPPYDPLVYCYVLHYQFETIHPFRDGNGRVGRALLSLMIHRWCELSAPWLYMSAYFERYKDEYVDNLLGVSARGDWSTWVEFCLRGTVAQAVDSIGRCEALRQLREELLGALDASWPRVHAIVEGLFTVPGLTVPLVADRYEITYPTAKSDVERLVEVGVLKEIPDIHPRTFYCPQIFDIAHRDGP